MHAYRTPILAALLLALCCAPATLAGEANDTCKQAAGVFCPGAPAGTQPNGSAFFDETTNGLTLQELPFVVTFGDLVICDGAAKADNSGCDTGVNISDILRFKPDPTDKTKSLVDFLSDKGSAGDMDHAEEATNGADNAGSLTPGTGHNWYISEALLKPGGFEKNFYHAVSKDSTPTTGDIKYQIISDNPEPSTLLLMCAGVAVLGARGRRRLA